MGSKDELKELEKDLKIALALKGMLERRKTVFVENSNIS